MGRSKSGSDKPEERQKALELAERAGIPLWGAFRVVRGEVTLNQLLKSMLRREKFQRLQKEGLDPDLAGHVASGSLPRWRAAALQEMRKAGRTKFTRDRLEISHRAKEPLALWRFGQDDWEVGRVTKSRTYDFTYETPSSPEPVVVDKHNVKMVCSPEDLEVLRKARKHEKQVLKQELGASKDRNERYRPADQQLCNARDQGANIRWIFRDGTAVVGQVQAFGRWDIDVIVDSREATLFFHALHRATDRHLADYPLAAANPRHPAQVLTRRAGPGASGPCWRPAWCPTHSWQARSFR